jgi:serine phosphatase RsbU (regulator of sigma subunit)
LNIIDHLLFLQKITEMSRLHVIWNRVVLFFRKNTGLKNIIVAAILLELATGAMYYAAQWAINRTALEYTVSELEAREISYFHDSNPDYLIDNKEVFDTLNEVRRLLVLLVIASLALITFIVYRASKHLERLRVVSAEKKRITGELHVAGRIQQSMLPEHHIHLDEVEVVGSLVPAKEVGGDLFDYFVRDEKLFFCIGDVSGKGVPSAMMMAGTHSLFRAASAHENDPARIMASINETLCQGTNSNMFVTLFIGVLDLPTGHLHYCNAGHNPPIVLDPQPTTLDCEANLPVGVFVETKYECQAKQLQTGDILFLYTDGLTEAMNSRHKQFGIHRVEETLTTIAEKLTRTEDILDTMSTEVSRFVGNAEQSDDLTMLVIQCRTVIV